MYGAERQAWEPCSRPRDFPVPVQAWVLDEPLYDLYDRRGFLMNRSTSYMIVTIYMIVAGWLNQTHTVLACSPTIYMFAAIHPIATLWGWMRASGLYRAGSAFDCPAARVRQQPH